MPLNVGTRLGHYDVTALLGEGGMGQVWQATDTQLNRQVALKILPDAFAADPDRLARFTREAQILASLNHPNIAAIYGIEEAEGTRALVLELVEGPTVADRISKGPIPLDEALPIAKQIAEALEAAHEAGVIHRDLKPASIKVREDGTVKVLDFGLAKALDPDPDVDPSLSPTLTAAATQMGVIMGTAAYMSPEQARGKPVDKRADIWAFGVVLLEMLTARKVFEGEDVSMTLSGVLQREPDWSHLPSAVSPSLLVFLHRCLDKDPKQRVGDIRDVRLAMEGAFETPASPSESLPPTGSRRLAPLVTFVAGALLAGGAFWALTGSQPTAPGRVIRYVVGPPDGHSIGPTSEEALSPDGHRLVYSATDAGGLQRLFLLERDEVEAVPLAGTTGAIAPFFSPDGEWVGFGAGNALKTLSLAGGTAKTLATGDSIVLGAAWGPDDTDRVHLWRRAVGSRRGRGRSTSADERDGGGEPPPPAVPPGRLGDGLHHLHRPECRGETARAVLARHRGARDPDRRHRRADLAYGPSPVRPRELPVGGSVRPRAGGGHRLGRAGRR